MNSFLSGLKVVLVAAALALLAGGVYFHRVQGRRVRQDVETQLKAMKDGGTALFRNGPRLQPEQRFA
jgi:uncharacterized protein HemX